MLNRIYIEANDGFAREIAILRGMILKKSGTDVPLVRLRKIIELRGDDVTDGVVERLKEIFVSELSENVSSRRSPISTSMSVMQRPGRSDAFTEEIRSILRLAYPEKDITVYVGKEYIFSEQLTRKESEVFTSFVKNPLSQVTPGEKEKEHEAVSETQISQGFSTASYTELAELKEKLGLKMDIDDLMCVQNYILSESRQPTYAEIKIIDNFFSESFRNTTCETILDGVEVLDPIAKAAWEHYTQSTGNPYSLSDMFRVSKQNVSSENVIDVGEDRGIKLKGDDGKELILMLGSESRNRSVSAVPYDGAIECLGNASINMLSKLGYVYDSYRVTGTSDKSENICRQELSFEGYAEHASEISVPCSGCTRIVSDFYTKKQLEICAVLGLADGNAVSDIAKNEPVAGDIVFLIGGETGKDGSKCFKEIAVSEDGHPENEKGEYVPVSRAGVLNALKRLLLRDDAAGLIKSVRAVENDGIPCALGDMAKGVNVYCNAVPLKYEGVFVSDIILSGSQDRMIACVSPDKAKDFEALCKEENVLCAKIAEITDNDRLTVYSDDKCKAASLTNEFIISGGAEKHLSALVEKAPELPASKSLEAAKAPFEGINPLKKLFVKDVKYDFAGAMNVVLEELKAIGSITNMRFDETAGGSSVSEPFSKRVSDAAVRYLSYKGERVYSDGKPLCSAIALGLSPAITDNDPYKGAYLSVTEALMRLVSSGFGEGESYTALFEYLPEHKKSGKRLGVAVSATLGAFEAQKSLETISLGGRISMTNAGEEYEQCSAVSAFALSTGYAENVITHDFKNVGNRVVLISPEYDKVSGLPTPESQKEVINTFNALASDGKVLSACSVTAQSAAAGIVKMCRSADMGFAFDEECSVDLLFDNCYGALIVELDAVAELPKGAEYLGTVSKGNTVSYKDDSVVIFAEAELEPSEEDEETEDGFGYSEDVSDDYGKAKTVTKGEINVIIPVTALGADVFDIKAKFEAAGALCKTVAFSEKSISVFADAIDGADIVYLPDSFNSQFYMKAVLSLPEIKEKLNSLKERGGLIYGAGASAEALIDSGLLEADRERLQIGSNPMPGLTNAVADVELCSVLSPFMRNAKVGDRFRSIIKGKRLRLFGDAEYVKELAKNGRIASRYAEKNNVLEGLYSIDALTSADGHVMAQISRPDRLSSVSGVESLDVISSAVGYFDVSEKQNEE